jgi:hypothetical protein
MSSTEDWAGRGLRTNRSLKLAGIGAGAIVVLILFLYLTLGGSTPGTGDGNKDDRTGENALDAARAALAKDTDLDTCRSALQQINTHLARGPGERPPALDPAEKERLRDRFGLTGEELAEVESSTYTFLDAQYLDCCFLLRDAARSLDVKAPGAGGDGKSLRPAPTERAAAAFAWVVRQVRLEEDRGEEPVPPQFVLRRGWGTALDRSLIFLALLEQVGHGDEADPGPGGGLVGCLLLRPGKEPAGQRLWACGVAAEVDKKRNLYLFDPRLGLPLPGPGGRGIATLAAARTGPAMLAQLTVESGHRGPTHFIMQTLGAHGLAPAGVPAGSPAQLHAALDMMKSNVVTMAYPYDVTAERARAAEVYQVCPLSALAPRMRTLQDQLLPPAVRVRLAADPEGDRKKFEGAAGTPGRKKAEVRVWKEGTGLLRRFLPPDEGGVDPVRPFRLRDLGGFTTPDDLAVVQMQRRQLFVLELAPWPFFPPLFRDPRRFRFDVGLGERVHAFFASPFVRSATEPGAPRDLVLRGRFSKAAPELVQEQERWQQHLNRIRAAGPGLGQGLNTWLRQALEAYADLYRAQDRKAPEAVAAAERGIADLWTEKEAEPVYTLLLGAMAVPRGAEVKYLLALCKHEQAERLQARLDLARAAGAAPNVADVNRARDAWKDARRGWEQFGDDYAAYPVLAAERAAARRMLGRAQALLGERQAAAASWRDLSGSMTPLEKTAALYQAQQLSK